MGSSISQQQSIDRLSKGKFQNFRNNNNWKVLQQSIFKQIYKSKRSQLIIQQYNLDLEDIENYQKQKKLYDWRNQNPNSQFMVNALSVNKDQIVQESGCGCGFCPSNKFNTKVYVVTQRILRLQQFQQLQSLKLKIEKYKIQKSQNATYLSEYKFQKQEEKNKSFLNIQINYQQSKRILKDWIRGIQVLCYKFGYFKISKQLLGITLHKKGNVWINQNFAQNTVQIKKKYSIHTAQQKYKYQKQTIQKILQMIQNIQCFMSLLKKLRKFNINKFDDFFKILDQISNQNLQLRKIKQPFKKREHYRTKSKEQCNFQNKKDQNLQYKSKTHKQIPLSSKNQPQDYSRFVSVDQRSFQQSPRIIFNRFSADSYLLNELRKEKLNYQRKNNQRKIQNIIDKQQIYLNSNHKNCGKQTAPTNQLYHSSQLNSINNHSNHLNRKQQNIIIRQINENGKYLYKSQNNKIDIQLKQIKFKIIPQINNQKINLHNNNKQGIMYFPQIKNNQQHIFHSQNYVNSPKIRHNLSADQSNLIGPYQKDKFFNNLNNQKIALVDSMVIVQQQNQQISDTDMLNFSGNNIVLEQSIIIRGGANQSFTSKKQINQKIRKK